MTCAIYRCRMFTIIPFCAKRVILLTATPDLSATCSRVIFFSILRLLKSFAISLAISSGLSGEVQPAEAMCDLVENEYIKRLLRNASDSYIRFALSTGHYADKIKEEKDKMTELLENGELKKVEKSLDVYFKLLARAVNEERGMNE